MFHYTKEITRRAEEVASSGSAEITIKILRALSLADFGEVFWSLPSSAFPNLSAVLPKMADALVQDNWTGTNGHTLLAQTLAFVSCVRTNFTECFRRKMENLDVLDFGCGYGRFIRLMYYFTEPSRIWGVDPWDEALKLCKDDRVIANFGLSDYYPITLPVDDQKFELIYAFSVFTHTSERATRFALQALRRCAAPQCLCFITIRPEEYWSMNSGSESASEGVVREHRENGFAFRPHNLPPINGDIYFGDTSMTIEWLKEAAAPNWEIRGLDRSLSDPYQLVVILKPA